MAAQRATTRRMRAPLNIDLTLWLLVVCALALTTTWFATFNHAAIVCRSIRHDDNDVTRIVFVADPQMEGLARVEREGTYGWFNNVLNDHMLRIALRSLLRRAAPTSLVIALGDLFYSQYLSDAHFAHIFTRYQHVVTDAARDFQVPLLNLSGNHDIGYGAELRADSNVVERFVRHFGALNHMHVFAGHLFVVVNSLALDGSVDHSLYLDAWAHVDAAAAHAAELHIPVILLVHIPLYKPSYSCLGDAIEQIRIGAEWLGAYDQTVLTANTTQLLLERLQPVLVFSGHDHEGCVYNHSGGIVEHTVRAAQGFYETNLAVLSIIRRERDDSYHYQVDNCPFWHTNYYCVLLALTGVWIVALVIAIATKRVFVDDFVVAESSSSARGRKQR